MSKAFRQRSVAVLVLATMAGIAVAQDTVTVQTIEVAPSLTHETTPAPGRGVKPGLSRHRAALPDLFRLEAQAAETLSPLISRQVLHGAQSTFVKWTMKKGAVVPVHAHPNEQITWLLTGSAEIFSQGRKFSMRAGDVMIIPPNVPHEFHFLEDSIDIDIFAPQRQDWIDGTASYIPKK